MVTPATRPTAYTGIADPTPGNNWFRRRAPLSSDFKNYKVGDRWLDLAASQAYIMVARSPTSGTWQNLAGSGGGGVTSVTPDVGLPIIPVAGNISIAGNYPAYGLRTVTNAVNQIVLENIREPVHYVVNANGLYEYTTIQAAINQAQVDGAGPGNPKKILIYPGQYIEDLKIPTGIVLEGQAGDGRGQPLQIVGLTTILPGAFVQFNGISFIDNGGGTALTSTGDNSVVLVFECQVIGGGNAIYGGSPGGNTYFFDNCAINSGAISIFLSNLGQAFIHETQINSGGSAVVTNDSTTCYLNDCNGGVTLINGSLDSNNGSQIIVDNCLVIGFIAASSNSQVNFISSILQGGIFAMGTSLVTCTRSSIGSNAQSAFNITSVGATITASLNTVDSLAASGFWATGIGNFKTSNTNTLLGTAVVLDPGLITTVYPAG